MERLTLACGGTAVNSVEDLSKEALGFAKNVWEKGFSVVVFTFCIFLFLICVSTFSCASHVQVYEHSVGEERYTFIEGVENPFSVTILIKGPNKFSILQMKDAIRDGIRAVKNTIEDGHVIPGAGAFEVAAYLV
jgi:T-complex protein 1 subunit zeta